MTTVAEFKIEFLQYLDSEGKPISTLPDFANDSNILLSLYKEMVKTRLFDAKAVALQRTGKMGTFPSSLGQEAVAVGMGHAMAQEDIFCPYYRDQGAMFMRGVSMQEILAYWGGDERGSDFKGPRQDFPIAVPVASQCLHATGCAYAIKYRKEKRAVVTTVGDGGTSKGDFYEAMNLAGDWNLPVVFIINNNQWAISVPLAAQTHTKTLAQKAIAAGFEGIQVDGNDVIAVREAVARALKRAKEGNGPTLIEAITYRLCDHTTADDAKRYIEGACIESAWINEPIKRLYNYLMEHNLWSKEQEEELKQGFSEEIDAAVSEYLNMPPQPATSILAYHYESWPTNLQDQWDELGAIDNA
ncbi:MAG: pyruvate dehydrogenase (acetyl-transferring) E1 component subunit alpha [Gammaproteobacteria bacterium]|nr:pyruvate dehydrogenase (acetyl-transferring) E1 component subunit alpha [Gammaproteobacteria bacterium]